MQVKSLESEADRLSEIHPDEKDSVCNKQTDINEEWAKLSKMVGGNAWPRCHISRSSSYRLNLHRSLRRGRSDSMTRTICTDFCPISVTYSLGFSIWKLSLTRMNSLMMSVELKLSWKLIKNIRLHQTFSH